MIFQFHMKLINFVIFGRQKLNKIIILKMLKMSMSLNQLHEISKICNFCLKKFEGHDNSAQLRCCKNCFDEINAQNITLVTQQGNLYSLYVIPSMFNVPINTEQKQQELQTTLNSTDYYTDLKKLIAQQVQNTIEKWRNIHQLYQDCPKTFMDKNEEITAILYSYNDKINLIKNQMFEEILKLDQWKKQISLEDVSIDNPEEIKQGDSLQLISTTTQQKLLLKKETILKSQKKNQMKKVQRKNIKIQPQAVFYEDNTNTINWKKGVTFSTGQRNLYDLDQQSLLSKSEFYTKMNNLKRKIFQYLLEQNKTPITLCRLHVDSIYQIVINTTTAYNCIELVSFKITQNFSFGCYLAMLDWSQVQILKLVKVNLTDKIMVSVIDFLQYHENKIETLVLTNNRITEQSIKYLQKAQLKNLKNIYLGKNAINSLKARKQLKKVKQLYNIYI